MITGLAMKRSEHLTVADIETVLNNSMHSVRSKCKVEADRTLTVQLSYQNEDFTVVGISRDQYRDLQALRELGRHLLEEIEATIIMSAMRSSPSSRSKAQAH